MSKASHKAKYWLRKRRAALNVLANVTATDEQRHRARCRLNRSLDVMRRLRPVAPMKRELATDRIARKARARTGAAS